MASPWQRFLRPDYLLDPAPPLGRAWPLFLLLAVNIPTMFKYMACSYCAVRIVDRHPEIAGGAALGWSHGKVRAIGYAGVVLGLIIAVLGVEADIRPYLLVAGWAVVGLVYWWAIGRRGS